MHLPLYFKSERAQQPLPSAWGTTDHSQDPCSHSHRTGNHPHLTLQLGKCFGPKSKAQRQPRQRLPRGEEEHDASAQPQHFQVTRFQKHFPGCTHLVPTAKLCAALPFLLVCRRGQLGFRKVGRRSHNSLLEAARVPLSPQFRRGSAHLVKRRSSTCVGVPKALTRKGMWRVRRGHGAGRQAPGCPRTSPVYISGCSTPCRSHCCPLRTHFPPWVEHSRDTSQRRHQRLQEGWGCSSH